MSLRSRSAQLTNGRVALILAFICLWMSSGATLRHTDDLSEYRTFAAGQTVLRHLTPTPVSVPCVAHEWMNAWQTLPATYTPCVRFLTPLSTLQAIASPSLHLTGFDYVSLRGPPSLSS